MSFFNSNLILKNDVSEVVIAMIHRDAIREELRRLGQVNVSALVAGS